MKITRQFFYWIAEKFKIPPFALKMFKASNDISGIDKKTLPTELIPLNSIQISRGLLNFTFFQARLDWVLPFWAEEQYNPYSKAFIPRSHTGLSMNVTNRNWTAVGNTECNIEPIVDPKGMVTPFVNGWSVDFWIKKKEKIFFPSKEKDIRQTLVNDLPVVKTEYQLKDLKIEATTFVQGKTLSIKLRTEGNLIDGNLIIAIRPFNPEGISLIKSIEFKNNLFTIDEKKIGFDRTPDFIYCSNFEEGDSAKIVEDYKENFKSKKSVFCETGLANAIALFNLSENFSLNISCNLEEENTTESSQEPEVYWNELLRNGTEIITPDSKLNSLLKSSLTTVLLFCDKDKITPGPFTYHQFWFRDAAYMIYSLDRFGFHNFSRKIINTFAQHQDAKGYFRSQKGEWDSNGQALWTIYQHAFLSNDMSFIQNNFNILLKGVQWIDKTRSKNPELKGKNIYGLLPKGLSAEHVGLADYYFWDNFWSLAGIKSFIKISELLHKEKEKIYAQSLLNEYMRDVEQSIKNAQEKFKTTAITSSATRGIDCGIIGSICASYPLQLFKPVDTRMMSLLEVLTTKYFYKGLFFQHFIHSGMNPYLTLQIAHSYLFSGDREKFNEIFNSVFTFASPTNNFPEAIHPFTGGGCMGDGHHGWVAAEILLSIADAFAYEYDENIFLLAGIPKEWFEDEKSFEIKNLKLKSGSISLFCLTSKNNLELKIDFKANSIFNIGNFIIKLPFKVKTISDNCEYINGESIIICKSSSATYIITKIP